MYKTMLQEIGRVVAINSDSLMVETIQQSTCSTCSAKAGCGQRLLSSLGQQTGILKVPLPEDSTGNYQLGDAVTIGIEDDIVVRASLLAYLLPLILMLVFSFFAHRFYAVDGLTIVAGICGLVMGGVLIYVQSLKYKSHPDWHPVLIDKQMVVLVEE